MSCGVRRPPHRRTAVVDVYWVAGGKLAEHWDVKEAVPEANASGNPVV
jgi:predicted SnoaL-like aldol condensation-catalyzing enzyme